MDKSLHKLSDLPASHRASEGSSWTSPIEYERLQYLAIGNKSSRLQIDELFRPTDAHIYDFAPLRMT